MGFSYYFFPLTKEEFENPNNRGRTYTFQNRSRWVGPKEEPLLNSWANLGFAKGCNYIVHDGKAFMIYKAYLDLVEDFCVFLCTESVQGCDIE